MNRHDIIFSARLFHAIFYKEGVECLYADKEFLKCWRYKKSQLQNLLVNYFPEYNYLQLNDAIESFSNNVRQERFFNPVISKYWKQEESEEFIDLFELIFVFSENILTKYENRCCFKYSYTDVWREITKQIGEEIFVIADIIQHDNHISSNYSRHIEDMDWSYCVEHDNHALHMMLRRDNGISENHFHLRGSSPYFDISWIYLMNNIEDLSYERFLDDIENNRLNDHTESAPLKLLWKKAAAIRLVLYLLIQKDSDEMTVTEWLSLLQNEVLPYRSKSSCTFPSHIIQNKIKTLNLTENIDYAQGKYSEKQKYPMLLGERWIIYNCLKNIYNYSENYDLICSLLLYYLKIKNIIFSEMVQSNNRIGFHNFDDYQRRKDGIIPWANEKAVASDTICSIIDNQKLYRAELRITPQSTISSMIESISIYDAAIENAIEKTRQSSLNKISVEENFFYTLHFIKFDEKHLRGECRFSKLRKENIKKMKVIAALPYQYAKRIYGIDACAEEINCRPEVFGYVFRYLQYHLPKKYENDKKTCPQLKATYHVGEDNYDLVDGLRAIDEAVTFLGMRSGCRLGHATLLGISYSKYYSIRKNTVSMPQQVFLDNIIWVYYFFIENGISLESIPNLQSYLERKFKEYFAKIYQTELYAPQISETLCAFNEYIHDSHKTTIEHCSFDINNYIGSWLLRGDDPLLYKEHHFFNFDEILLNSDIAKICHDNGRTNAARNTFESNYLYYMYHYNSTVKERGDYVTQEVLPDYFVQAVNILQDKLKEKLYKLGISLETNPSSNVSISIISNYAEHPIQRFYSNDLDFDKPWQLSVSVNTDDKSVFSTSLSNEYAYLLYFFENETDSEGNYKYKNPRLLLNWLNEIRKMGNEQSFSY